MKANEIAVKSQEELMLNGLTSSNMSFTSLKGETQEEKARLYQVMNNPEFRIADCINQTIYVKDVFVEVVDILRENTGEVDKCPRVVLIDKDGNGYQSVSFGIFSAVKKLFQVFGAPTWEDPIGVTVKQITKGTNKMLTLDIASTKSK